MCRCRISDDLDIGQLAGFNQDTDLCSPSDRCESNLRDNNRRYKAVGLGVAVGGMGVAVGIGVAVGKLVAVAVGFATVSLSCVATATWRCCGWQYDLSTGIDHSQTQPRLSEQAPACRVQ